MDKERQNILKVKWEDEIWSMNKGVRFLSNGQLASLRTLFLPSSKFGQGNFKHYIFDSASNCDKVIWQPSSLDVFTTKLVNESSANSSLVKPNNHNWNEFWKNDNSSSTTTTKP